MEEGECYKTVRIDCSKVVLVQTDLTQKRVIFLPCTCFFLYKKHTDGLELAY